MLDFDSIFFVVECEVVQGVSKELYARDLSVGIVAHVLVGVLVSVPALLLGCVDGALDLACLAWSSPFSRGASSWSTTVLRESGASEWPCK